VSERRSGREPRANKQRPQAAAFQGWRRRPDLNRGWRFCRFNGVVNRVVSCWSLVCPAPPFYLVLGPYWTTFGLRLPVIAPTAILLLSPSARPVRGRTILLRFVTRIPDLIRRDERSLECICCAGPQPSGFGVPLVSGRTPGGELSGRFESQAYNQLNLKHTSRRLVESRNPSRPND